MTSNLEYAGHLLEFQKKLDILIVILIYFSQFPFSSLPIQYSMSL